jgi:hypothetical protein
VACLRSLTIYIGFVISPVTREDTREAKKTEWLLRSYVIDLIVAINDSQIPADLSKKFLGLDVDNSPEPVCGQESNHPYKQ